jgi:hypothetical protein
LLDKLTVTPSGVPRKTPKPVTDEPKLSERVNGMVIPPADREPESVPASDVLVPPTTVIMLRDAWPRHPPGTG